MPEKTKILIVDDDINFCGTLSKIMSRKGYETTSADSGSKALVLVKEKEFNMVLMDIKMPVMNGLEVYKEFKKIKP